MRGERERDFLYTSIYSSADTGTHSSIMHVYYMHICMCVHAYYMRISVHVQNQAMPLINPT